MKSCLFFFFALTVLGALGFTIGYNYLVNLDTKVAETTTEEASE